MRREASDLAPRPQENDIWREKRLRPLLYEPRFVRVLSVDNDEGRMRMWGVELNRGIWVQLRRHGRRNSYSIALKEFTVRFTLHARAQP